jgi:hypothetical protein
MTAPNDSTSCDRCPGCKILKSEVPASFSSFFCECDWFVLNFCQHEKSWETQEEKRSPVKKQAFDNPWNLFINWVQIIRSDRLF